MLDLKTLSIILAFETLCFAMIIIYMNSRRKYAGVDLIGLGMFFSCVSGVLMAFQGIIPSIFSIVLFGTATVISVSVMNHGFRRFLDLGTSVKIHCFLICVTFAWTYYFSEIKSDYMMRVIFFSVVYFCLFIDNFRILYFKYIAGIKNICRLTGLVFLFLAALYIVRGGAVIFCPEMRANNLMEITSHRCHYYLSLITISLTFFSLFLAFVCIIFMTTLRLETELLENHSKLKELNDDRDRFFSIIAHDLISPVSGIPPLIQLILSKYDTLSTAAVKDYLSTIHSTSNHVYSLLDNLLTWSKACRGQSAFEPVETNIYDIFQEAIKFNEESAKNKTLKLINNISHDFSLYCDANMTRTIIRNLLSNAVKFSLENGTIELSGGIKNGSGFFCVKDGGVGMIPDKTGLLFKSGGSCDRGTKGERGNGIGLLIVKEFVDKHGGKIFVESAENKGAAFYVEFPQKNKVNI